MIVTLLWFYVPSEGLASATPNALIVIGCLAGGDGFADIIGRKFGKWKYNFGGSEKSMEGSIGMFLGSLLFCLLLVTMLGFEVSAWNIATFIVPLVIISFIAMVIEAISPKNLDNWTITISVVLMLLVMNAVAPDFWPFPLFGGSILG